MKPAMVVFLGYSMGSSMSEPDVSDLIGKPFAEFGRGPDAYDCYGVWIEVRKRLQLPAIDVGSLAISLSEAIAEKIQNSKWMFQKVDREEVGDLVLFRGVAGMNTHIGAVIAHGVFLHGAAGIGIHRSKLNNPLYRDRIEGIYRYVG